MRILDALAALVVSAVFGGVVQSATAQSSAKAEVLAALAERDKAFVAGDETKLTQFMSEDCLQTDVSGNVQDKQAWLNDYYHPMAPLVKSGETRWITFDRSEIVIRDLGDTFIVAGKQTIKHVGADPWNPKDITPSSRFAAPASDSKVHSCLDKARRNLEAGRCPQRNS